MLSIVSIHTWTEKDRPRATTQRRYGQSQIHPENGLTQRRYERNENNLEAQTSKMFSLHPLRGLLEKRLWRCLCTLRRCVVA
jgi:hypothetical protein